MKQLTADICRLVRRCGSFIKNADRSDMDVSSKEGKGNFVTNYDKKVQEMLREGLLKLVPDAGFIGEEGEQEQFSDKGRFFIVDPIDGTTNFIRDRRCSCISVALAEDGEIVLGVVYDPYHREMFRAEKGKGAYLGRRRLSVSPLSLKDGLVLFGSTPYLEDLCRETFRLAYAYTRRAGDIRRSGSAALELCSIAAGKAELFFELRLSPWDYAAGSLILTEAGGLISDINGAPLRFDRPCSVLASNRAAANEAFPLPETVL